jgi:hypothetical protein
MLDANDPNFFQRYPNGATVYDRTGRQLHGVVACNPDTGEVVRWDESRIVGAVLRMARGREEIWIFRRHGFWPAPLTVVPNQWLHIGFDKE